MAYIAFFFLVVFTITLLLKIINNLKFRKGNSITDVSCSINPEFNDSDIPLSKALKNFRNL